MTNPVPRESVDPNWVLLRQAAEKAYALTNAMVASPYWDEGAKQCARPVEAALREALDATSDNRD